ncbi:MAG: serine protease [Patescibacteria group bacterium]|nr:serine protease [Patescibacteria group bacterium]
MLKYLIAFGGVVAVIILVINTQVPFSSVVNEPSVVVATSTVVLTPETTSTEKVIVIPAPHLSSSTLKKDNVVSPVVLPPQEPPISSVVSPVVAVPVISSPPITTATSSFEIIATSSIPAILEDEERELSAKTIVGLLCVYTFTNSSLAQLYGEGNEVIYAKGSGVIVNPEGYVITARHVVDPAWYLWAYGADSAEETELYQSMKFSHCEVGTPTVSELPTVDDIRVFNPQLELPHPFPYLAELYFVPPRGEMSDREYKNIDFAILKINKPRKDCEVFNLCTLPEKFPYSPVLYKKLPPLQSEVLNFGYPVELINSSGGAFTNFFLKGAVGILDGIVEGDKAFISTPIYIRWRADDVLPGRSGSPIFLDGYVIGIEYAGLTANVTENFGVSVIGIQRVLELSGLGNLLSTE